MPLRVSCRALIMILNLRAVKKCSGIACIILAAICLGRAESAKEGAADTSSVNLAAARLRFARDRQPVIENGLYQDLRAEIKDGGLWFPDLGTNGNPIAGSGKTFAGLASAVRNDSEMLGDTNAASWLTPMTNRALHVLVRELTEPLVREALSQHRVYFARDELSDPVTFAFGAMNNLGVFTLGDTAPMAGKTSVMALTPLKAKLRLFHEGELLSLVSEKEGTNVTFVAKEPGAYRFEAWLHVNGEDLLWICSAPVHLTVPNLAELRLPSMEISPDVAVRKNIVYREGSEADAPKHQLDVYRPNGKTNSPVLFFIHGGAWKSGDRSYYPPLGNRYARAGFVTVIPSYRLAPKHPHPAQIEDVAAAFSWTVEHAAEFGGDTNRIYVSGHSAGGHLAALLALDSRYLAAHKLPPKMIHGVLAVSGVYDLSFGDFQSSVFGSGVNERRDASPLAHVAVGAPPFKIMFCEHDYFTLPAQARMFHRALSRAGVKSELVYIPRESHISEMLSFASESDFIVEQALEFMR
jgi:acetyl esterase/lipase